MRWNYRRVNGNDRWSPRKISRKKIEERSWISLARYRIERFFLRGFGIAIRATGDWSHSRLTLIGPTHCQVWLELGVTTVSNPVIRSVHRAPVSSLFIADALDVSRQEFRFWRPLTDIFFGKSSANRTDGKSFERRTMISWKIKLGDR